MRSGMNALVADPAQPEQVGTRVVPTLAPAHDMVQLAADPDEAPLADLALEVDVQAAHQFRILDPLGGLRVGRGHF